MAKTKTEILYHDNNVMVINKPSGASVTKSIPKSKTLAELLNGQLDEEAIKNLHRIHRLDDEASGVLMIGKNKAAQTQIIECLDLKNAKQTYLALVNGCVIENSGVIKAMITRSKHDANKMTVTKKNGKNAVTRWQLLADFGQTALLAVWPVTDRAQQIRVHMPKAGMPLAIDQKYGSKRLMFLSDFKAKYNLAKQQKEKPLMERLTLHHYQIDFNENCHLDMPKCFVAKLDKKFAATMKLLTKHNSKGLEAFVDPENYSKIVNGEKLSIF